MNTIKLALVQTDLVWENTQANLDKLDLVLQDIEADTEMVILPEVFSTGFALKTSNFEKPVGVKAFNWLKNKAISLNKIVVGSVIFEEDDKYFNRLYWMRPDGTFEFYDKRHLFQMGKEHEVITAGAKHTIVTYKNTKFNLQICYDLRFPVWAKNKYDKETNMHDYDVLLYIANWPNSRKNAYMSLLKARAIENQSFVVWVNRVGVDGHNDSFSGDSLVLNSQGKIQSQALENQETVLYSELNLDALKSSRLGFKVGLDWDTFEIS